MSHKYRLHTIGVTCGAAILIVATGCQSPSPHGTRVHSDQTYRCVKQSATIVVDGKLDEPVWEAIEPIKFLLTNTGKAPRQLTWAKAFWNAEGLAIAFNCPDTDIWTTYSKHDDPLFNEEVVEVFIDSDGWGTSYIELEVNPRNAVIDLYILNPGDRSKAAYLDGWSPKELQTAVQVDGTLDDRTDHDTGWTCEMMIPWTVFLTRRQQPPRPGETWYWNLYRIDRPATPPDEYSAWSPTGAIDFHRPDKFGCVTFVER